MNPMRNDAADLTWTVRDEFAVRFLPTVLGIIRPVPGQRLELTVEDAVAKAYQYADACLVERSAGVPVSACHHVSCCCVQREDPK